MRPIRLAAIAVIVAPLLLTACLPLPAVPPAQSQPAPSTPGSTEPAQPSTSPSAPAPSTPTTSEPTESTEPAGDFELVLDGTPIDSPWVAGITCSYSSGFGVISSDSDGDTDYFSALLDEEGDSISASLVVLSVGGESYLGTGENTSLTLEGGQLSGTIELTSNFTDTATLEISGSCGA